MRTPSRIDDDFTGRTAEQDIQAIQNVATEDTFTANKIRLKSARVLLSVQLGPHLKAERSCRTPSNAADQALHTQAGIQSEALAIRPGQDAGIRPRVGESPDLE
jgi:hypothetical protein